MDRIPLQPALSDWIDLQLPGLKGVKNVRIFACEKLPFQTIYRGQKFSGLTLWNRIYIRNTYKPMSAENLDFVGILLHELLHVQQFGDNPILCPIRYIYYSARYGYWENPMETVVYEQTENLLHQYRLDRPWES